MPELFILILLIAFNTVQPGETSPRFVAVTNLQGQLNTQTEAADEAQTTSARDLLLNEGQRLNEYLQGWLSGARFFNVAGGAVADLDDETAARLEDSLPGIIIEELNSVLVPELTQLSNKQSSDAPSGIQPWNYQQCGATGLKEFGHTGRGMHIGIVAQNFSYEHTALEGRIKNVNHFGVKPPERSTNDLHLVHPLGILAGFEEGRFEGLAPEAEISLALLAVKPGKADSLLAAIEWLVTQPQPPQVILFCTDFASAAPLAVSRALFACRNAGIIPVVAAGNNPNQITGMAALPCCVTIAALDRWKQRALFSGQGPVLFDGLKIIKPDFCQPGSAVTGPSDIKEYRMGSGTLQAAAHFAGVFLLMRQALPDTDPEYLLNAIKSTCLDIGDTGPDDATGYGLPVPAAAISLINNPPQQQ